ncbi:MAG TPA: AMP-binding protein [Lachnospiraceae bacterium]|nr:AMP-binding protein [Lachnospiraceae bacterium]
MKSIHEYLTDDYNKWGECPYISTWDGSAYQSVSFRQTIEDVWNLAKGMKKAGLQNQNIMIFSDNSYEWMVIDLAVMGYVGTCVPVDKEWTAYDIGHALSAIDVAAVFYSKSKESRVEELRQNYPNIEYFCIEEAVRAMIEEGAAIPKEPEAMPNCEQTAMILFTSGTTNIAKAIPLSQANLFNNWDTLFARTPMTNQDISYVFLPLNHVYSGVANFLYTIISGMQIYLCSDIRNVLPEMMQVRPTVVCMVPLILKRIYEVIQASNDEKVKAGILNMLKGIRFLYCGGSFTDLYIKKYG